MSKTDEGEKLDLTQWAMAQIKVLPIAKWAPFLFGISLCAIVWARGSGSPAIVEESKSNPVKAAATLDPAANNGDAKLLPDAYNVAQQQLVSLRGQQIRAEFDRAVADKKNRCYKKSPVICGEQRLSELSQKLTDTIGDDGSLKVTPNRALELTLESQAVLTAMSGLGVKDADTERLVQIYLPATDGQSTNLSGVAASIQGTDLYLERRRVDRLSSVGKSDEIPQLKRNARSSQTALDR